MKSIKNVKLYSSPDSKARVLEREIDGKIIRRNFEFINDKMLDDMDILSDPSISVDFSNYPYEKTFYFESEDDIRKLIDDKESKKKLIEFLQRNKFLYTTWEAKIPKDFTVSIELMKEFLLYTADIFDEVTIPYWGFDISDYKELWNFAENEISNSLACWVDLKNNDIISLAPFLSKLECMVTAKFGFGKFDTHFPKYAFALQAFSNKLIYLHLNGCAIRTGINKSESAVAHSAIALGFNSTTRNCPKPTKNSKFIFPKFSDHFDEVSCKYKKISNEVLKTMYSYDGNFIFRKSRVGNINRSNEELLLSSNEIIENRYDSYLKSKDGLKSDAEHLGIL